METILDRSYGALLGVFVGDAAGAVLEFYTGKVTEETASNAITMPGGGVLRVGKGQITDDSELALSLAHALTKTVYHLMQSRSITLTGFFLTRLISVILVEEHLI
jgi:ADP-ribosylglycohydrolase